MKQNGLKDVILTGVLIVGLSLFITYKSEQKLVLTKNIQPSYSPQTIKTSISEDTDTTLKIFRNSDFSFNYPSYFEIDNKYTNERITVIKSLNPTIRIITSTKGLMYGECLNLKESKTVGNLFIRKFTRVNEGDMCSGATNPNEINIWITKVGKENYFGPGISFVYESNQELESEKIINQIISSFKFTD